MNRSLIISSVLHGALIFITAMSLPFLAKKPLDIPPIVSVELIQIAEKTNIPFAPKAKKIIENNKANKIFSVAGGGDTVSLLNNLNAVKEFNFVSTAGGAFLEYLEGKNLPGITALN